MHHTYTLTSQGILSPAVFRSSDTYQARVTDPRSLVVAHTSLKEPFTLVLLEGEPDLPVGSTVSIWLSRWFHCETLEYIQHKKDESAKRAAEKSAYEADIKRRAEDEHLTPIQNLLESSPSKKHLKMHLDALHEERGKQYRIYRAYWGSAFPEIKQKSDDAYTVVSTVNSAIELISEYVFAKLNSQGIHGVTAYAYSPREGGSNGAFSPGADHFQLTSPLNKGRLKREQGDALCKPSRKFWGLTAFDNHRSVTCRSCLLKMINLIEN